MNDNSGDLLGTQARTHGGVATDLGQVDLTQWQAEASRWRGRQAVALPGAFADTAAVTNWTPEAIASRFQDVEVGVKCKGSGKRGWEPMPMARFVALLLEGKQCALRQLTLAKTPGLGDELDISRAVDTPDHRMNLWLSNETQTPFHFDRSENVFVQVYGTKRFIIEPPTSPARRYMHAGERSHISRVDPQKPDADQFPEYHAGYQSVALLGPGDALYLPPGWLHAVTTIDLSISVNCWFGTSI